MSLYRHILLALDLSEDSALITERAQQLAELHQAKLSLIHVVDYLLLNDAAYGSELLNADISEAMQRSAKQQLLAIADRLELPHQNCWLEMGDPKSEIIRVATEQTADLIVVGSHNRNFVEELFSSSTANGLLHHTPCDVLAVHLNQQ